MPHTLTDNEYHVINNILNGIIEMAETGWMSPEPALSAIMQDAKDTIEILKNGTKEESC